MGHNCILPLTHSSYYTITVRWKINHSPGIHIHTTPSYTHLRMMTSSYGNIFRDTGHLCGGIHRSPVNNKGQWRGALMSSLIYAWLNGWLNKDETGDLRRHRAHYDVTVIGKNMRQSTPVLTRSNIMRYCILRYPSNDNGKTQIRGQFNIKHRLTGIGISVMKMRKSRGSLIFIIGIIIWVNRHLYIESAPRFGANIWRPLYYH